MLIYLFLLVNFSDNLVYLYIMKEYKIYSLNDPETGEVRYVGKTVSPLYKRLSSHYRDKSKSYKTFWIYSLKKKWFKTDNKFN